MSEPAVIAVFGSSATEPGSPTWDDAERVGRELAEAGFAVVTGGYGGSMEAVSKGAADFGGQVVGVISSALFPGRTGANPHVGSLVEAASLHDRIERLTTMACGVIALPGSIGTAAELLIVWNLNNITRSHGRGRIPTVAVGERWGRLHELMIETGAVPDDIEVVATADEALRWLLGQPEVSPHLATR